ncbi:LLM class flavin-dependent oxidoreductase [Tianweitania populi]|uniref:Luciferase n=1 Tax=Tianweitania populi TaxID=1607949 RepID=A0A8J3DQH7_9HYPH|nr:LLM class flavin-dependent oxidoreductase [Tianweitania populi]GHD14919.1 luciferase [Tianweitania populi]
MQLGLYTFADVDPARATTGEAPAERLKNLIEEIELADQVGLDVFGLGEHHRPDYAASAPAVILAAAATRTKQIRLSSAVTVLSSDDPVRVFQQFATLDLLSGGRAEIMAGRGSFIESFPLFGYQLEDYDELYAEKLDLLITLRDQVEVTWEGKMRPSIHGRGVYPRPLQEKLPIWIAVGGTPQSVARAGHLGLPLALAIIGGEPHRFAPLFALYRQAAERAGHDAATLPTSINVHGYVAETSQAAGDEWYGPQAEVMNRIGRERGWGPTNRAHFESARSPRGAAFVGSPAEVVDKILANHALFKFDRFLIQMAIGLMPHHQIMKAIELFGTKVAPEVRKAVAAA